MLDLKTIESSLRLPVMNKYFIKYMVPELSQINNPSVSFDNPIKHKKVIVFGDTASGKSSFIRALNELYRTAYGADKVNSVLSGSIEDLLMYGLNDKLVQFQSIDDYTMVREKPDILTSFFKIRNIWKDYYKAKNGLIVSVFGLHRFFSSATELRSLANIIIVRSDSINPYDHSLIKRYIGEDGIADLSLLEEYREEYSELKQYTIFHTRSKQTGLVKFPLVTQDNMVHIKDLKHNYSAVDTLVRNSQIMKV